MNQNSLKNLIVAVLYEEKCRKISKMLKITQIEHYHVLTKTKKKCLKCCKVDQLLYFKCICDKIKENNCFCIVNL